jgi:hypothetical protein
MSNLRQELGIWMLLNALREFVSALRGNAGSAAQRRGDRR